MHRGPVLFEQVLDVAEQHVAEAIGRLQSKLFDDYVGFGERDTSELGRGVDGQYHFSS